MFRRLQQLVAPPVFANEAEARMATLLNTVLWGVLVGALLVASVTPLVLPASGWMEMILGLLILLVLGVHQLLRRGAIQLAKLSFTALLWLFPLLIALISGGVRMAPFSSFTIVVLIAALLLGVRAGFAYTALSALAGLALLYAEAHGGLPTPLVMNTPLFAWTIVTINTGAAVVVLHLALRMFQEALAHSQHDAQTLRAREQKYRVLFESNQAGVYHTTLGGEWIACNDKFARMLGYPSAQELQTQPVQDIYFSPTNRESFIARLQREGYIENHEARLKTRDGTPILVLENVILSPAQDQQPATIQGTCVDISERRLAYEKLRKNEARLSTLFNNSPISLWEEDFSEVKARFDALRVEGVQDFRVYLDEHPEEVVQWAGLVKILDVNQTSVEFFEAKDKEEISRNLPSYFSDDSLPVFKEEFICLAEGQSHFQGEIPVRTPKSGMKHLLINVAVVAGYEQTLGRVLISFIDITEWRKAQQRLQRNEALLMESQHISQMGSWELDMETNQLNWTDEIYRLFEIDPAAFGASYETFLSLIHPDDRELVNREYLASVENQIPYSVEHRLLMADGRVKYVHERGKTFYDQNGKPLRSVGTVHDISERRRMEQQLRDEQNLTGAILNNAGALFVVMDREGRIRQFNRAAEELSGYHFSEIEGEFPWETVLPPEDADTIHAQAFAALANNPQRMAGSYTNHWVSKNGERYLIDWSNTLLLDANGQMEFMVSVGIDITESRKAEMNVRAQARLLDLIFQHSQDSLVILDKDYNFIRVTESYARESGKDVSEFVGRNHFEMFPSDFKEEADDVKRGKYVYSKSARPFFFPDHPEWGATYWDLGLVPILDANEEVELFLFTLKNVTEQVKAAEALKASEDLLRRSQRIALMGSWEQNLVTNQIAWSDQVYRLFEVDRHEFDGAYQTFLDIVHPDDRAKVDEAYRSSIEGHSRYDVVCRLLLPDGRIKHIHEQGETFYDQDGKPLRTIGTTQDITERLHIEETLRQNEAQLSLIFNSTSDMQVLLRVEADGRLIGQAFNRAYKEAASHLFPDAPLDIVGRNRQDYLRDLGLSPEAIEMETPMYRAALEQCTVVRYESEFPLPSGNLTLDVSIAPVLDPNGKCTHLLWSARDVTERKLAEQDLLIKQAAIDSSNNAIAMAGLDGRIFYANPAFFNWWRLTHPDQVLGHVPSEFVADAPMIIDAMQRDGYWEGECLAQRSDGSSMDIHLAAQMVTDTKGQPVCLMASFVDITEHKKKNRAVMESEKKFRELYDAMMVGFVRVDMQGKFVEFNQEFQRMLGYSAEELRELTFPEITPPQWYELDLVVINTQLLPRGYSDLFEKEFIKKDGAIVAVAVQGALAKNDAGEPTGIWAWVQDITERKRSEVALRDAEARYRLLFEQSPYGVLLIDLETGQTVETNAVASRQLGYTREEFMALRISDYEAFENPEETRQHLQKLLDEESDDFETLHRTKSGEIRNVHVWAKAIHLGDRVLSYATYQDVTERWRAAEQIDYQANLLQNVTDAIYAVDAAFHITSWNRAAESLYGYTAGEVMGKYVTDIIEADYADRASTQIRTQLLAEGSWEGEITHKRKDGAWLDVFASARILKDHQGNITGAIGISHDITKQKAAEAARRESEAKFRAVVENTPDVVMIVDQVAAIQFINHTAPGLTVEQVLGTDSFLYLSPEFHDRYRQALENIFKGRESDHFEHRAGGDMWWESRLVPIWNRGAISAALVIARDITESKRAAEKLRESEERFAKAFNNSPLGIGIRRVSDDRFIDWNPTLGNMMGYTREQMLGKRLGDLPLYINPEDRGQVLEKANRREPIYGMELQIRRAEGDILNVLMSVDYITLQGDACALASFVDITKRIRAEEQVRASLREKEVLLKEIHHRVKNNLQIISSLLYLQSRKAEDPNLQMMLLESQNRVASMALIHEKLYQSTDLVYIAFADYARDLARTLFHSYGVEPTRISLTVEANELTLDINIAVPCGLIMNEIVSNSLKYAFPDKRKGSLRIALALTPDDHFSLTISDDGVGLPPDFQQLSASSLGMTLIERLTEQIDGTLERSSSHRGTRYLISFPRKG